MSGELSGGAGSPPERQWRPPHQFLRPKGPTNGLAVASLVLSATWLWWVGSILGLVLGYVAKSQIDRRGESGRGMALAGIILGWFGVGILGVAVFGLWLITNPDVSFE